MSKPRDDWDADERDALDGLEGELAEIRRRHQDDPSLAMLRAAAADALPPEAQARVARHLEESAWSRALVDGLRETGADDRLDAASEDRLFNRITRDARVTPFPSSRRPWQPAFVVGGLALAATVLIAVVVSRPGPDTLTAPTAAPPASARAAAAPIGYTKPDVKLSPSALTWRADASSNPFLRDLAPAFDAYRAGDYARAVAEFDRLAGVYPESIEVLFYQGVSRMLAGNEAGAIAPLEAAARLRNETFADDVSWFLAVAQERSGRPAARAKFEELCRGQGPYAARACQAVAQRDASTPAPRQP
jgi:tetratricopeptide (TPR) repeat protein